MGSSSWPSFQGADYTFKLVSVLFQKIFSQIYRITYNKDISTQNILSSQPIYPDAQAIQIKKNQVEPGLLSRFVPNLELKVKISTKDHSFSFILDTFWFTAVKSVSSYMAIKLVMLLFLQSNAL